MARNGRPTKYSKAICDRVIEMGRDGKSLTQIASALNVTRQTLYNWINEHPDFFDAVELSRTHSQAFYEDLHHAAVIGEVDVNPALIHRAMQCRFPNHWTPGQHITKDETVRIDDGNLISLKAKIDAIAKNADRFEQAQITYEANHVVSSKPIIRKAEDIETADTVEPISRETAE